MKPYLPSFISEQFEQGNLRGTFRATTLFADISGFTALTEQLMQHDTEGAEALSEILDAIFQPLVSCAVAQGGIIPHFAGDAFAAVFEGEKTALVAQIAHYFSAIFDKNAVFETPFGSFRINIRIGLSYGIVDWGIVGDTPKSFYMKGTAIERATLAQQKAEPQQVVMDAWFWQALDHQDAVAHQLDEHFFIIPKSKFDTSFQHIEKATPISKGLASSVSEHVLSHFLSQNILNFNQKGEFRQVISVFIAFDKVAEFSEIDNLARVVLPAFNNFGGYFKEIEFTDKGGVMVGFFGAPVAYENNAHRALSCVFAIREAIQQLKNPFHLRFGLTQGMAFTGIIGGVERCQYAVVGNRVNLAARFMQNAISGEILVSKSMSQTPQFEFKERGQLRFKGISTPVPTYQLLSQKIDNQYVYTGKVVGREQEIADLYHFGKKNLAESCPAFTYIFGEAGVGKSRLVFELRKKLLHFAPCFWATCPTDQILRKPFNPFIHFLKNYFVQKNEGATAENQQNFERVFDQLVRNLPEQAYTEGVELIRVQSVLAALVGLSSGDGLWEMLDARGRYDNTFAALASLFSAIAQTQPLVIDLEDTHWLDDDSTAFLAFFIKKIKKTPVFIIATTRLDDDGNKTFAIEPTVLAQNDWQFLSIDLSALSPAGLTFLAEQKLKGAIDKDLTDLLWRTSNGNPFYAEQILDYFIENDILAQKITENTEGVVSPENVTQWSVRDKNIKISTSISAILMARIDRLSSILKETVKAAAVIGREFELPVLTEVMLKHEEYARQEGKNPLLLKEQVLTAERGQIWRAMNELRYIFRHALLREAVYDMQLKTRLRELHAIIARAIEKVYAENLDDRFIDLAFHYEQANDQTNTHRFLKKASEFARRNFQNQLALDLYDRLLKNLEKGDERVKILMKKGEILQIIGRWHESELCFHEALFETAALGNMRFKAHAHVSLGTLQILKGEYEQAAIHLEKGVNTHAQNADNQGVAEGYGRLGTLHFRQGEYSTAAEYFEKSININRDLGLPTNTQIVANWGLTYMNQGNYTEGVRVQEEELARCQAEGDIGGMANLRVNLGIVLTEKGDDDAARLYLEAGLELAQQLGNKQLISIALGCIGNIWLNKNEFEKAHTFLEQDRQMVEELGDRQGIAIISELMGKYYFLQKQFDTAELWYQKSLAFSQQLHYQKGVAKSLHGLGKVANALKKHDQARRLLDEAILLAQTLKNQYLLGFCLVDKGFSLLAQGQIKAAAALQTETEKVSAFLKNEKLRRYALNFCSALKVEIGN